MDEAVVDAPRAVLAPLAPFGAVAGTTLLLVSVELWTRSTWLHVAYVATAATDAVDRRHAEELDAHDAFADERGLPPQHPALAALSAPIDVDDDVGTRYRPTYASAGGTGREWRATRRISPGVPAAATRLTLTAHDGTEVVLALPR